MKIFCIKGGLGNQMFEYCRYRDAQQQGKTAYLYYDYRRMKEHGGLYLDKCFDITLPSCPMWVMLLVFLLKAFKSIGIFTPLYNDEKERVLLIDDFCQNRKFISHAHEYFQFKKFQISEYFQQIEEAAYPVSIHVRRGDYLHPANIDSFGLCNIDYFKSCINKIQFLHPEATLFFFSDDPKWVRENLQFDNAIYIEHTKGEADYLDMYLMTFCKGHVISNSTFSFWGAYLSQSSDDITFYPRKWFVNPTWTAPDIFPSNWEAI